MANSADDWFRSTRTKELAALASGSSEPKVPLAARCTKDCEPHIAVIGQGKAGPKPSSTGGSECCGRCQLSGHSLQGD